MQFSEEYLDGRKGFVFSWNKKHRPIHEEALKHFFDPSKNGEKFEYQLSANPDPPSQARRVTPAETIPTKAEENKCSSGIGKITQEKGTFFVILRCSIVFFPDKMVDRDQAPVVQTLDSAIHRINHYPADKYYGNQLRYPLGNDLSCG